MQRLVLAIILLALIAGALSLFWLGARTVAGQARIAAGENSGTELVQKLAYAALLMLIAASSAGLLGGL